MRLSDAIDGKPEVATGGSESECLRTTCDDDGDKDDHHNKDDAVLWCAPVPLARSDMKPVSMVNYGMNITQ